MALKILGSYDKKGKEYGTVYAARAQPGREQLSRRKASKPNCGWDLYLGNKIVDFLSIIFFIIFCI